MLLCVSEEQIREVLKKEFSRISANEIDRVIKRLTLLDEVNRSGVAEIKENDDFIYIEDIDRLSTRAINALKKEGITTLKELKEFVNLEGIQGLEKIRNLGRKCLYELSEAKETKDIFKQKKSDH